VRLLDEGFRRGLVRRQRSIGGQSPEIAMGVDGAARTDGDGPRDPLDVQGADRGIRPLRPEMPDLARERTDGVAELKFAANA
jgi:hypothetical protein